MDKLGDHENWSRRIASSQIAQAEVQSISFLSKEGPLSIEPSSSFGQML